MSKLKGIIWIINEYAGSPYHGMEYRHYYLSRELIKRNYEVYIITASYSHLFFNLPDITKDFEIEKIDGIKYVWVKVPHYKNAYNKKRVIKWILFTKKLLQNKLVNKIKNPNYIIVSPMAPFPILAGVKWSKRFNAKLIYEIKDLWPLGLIELGGYSYRHPFILILSLLEKFAYKKSDKIVSVLPKVDTYLETKGIKREKFVYIPNGVFIESNFQSKLKNIQDWETKEVLKKLDFSKKTGEFIIIYTGNMGKWDALDSLLYGISKVSLKIRNLKAFLIGRGEEKGRLEQIKNQLGLKNVEIFSPISKKKVPLVLNYADVAYIGWREKKIYQYGISANKIFDYMLAAKPILHSYSGGGDLIKEANCGITVEAENPEAIAEGILKLYNMSPEERRRLGENGRKYVLEHHTYEKIADRFEEVFKELERAN